MRPMTKSRNCTCQQSLVNRRDQCDTGAVCRVQRRCAAALQSFLLADGLGTLLDVVDCGAAALKPLLLTIIAGRRHVL